MYVEWVASAMSCQQYSPKVTGQIDCQQDSQGNEEDDEDGVESDNSGSSEDESQATSPRSPAYHISGQPLPGAASPFFMAWTSWSYGGHLADH